MVIERLLPPLCSAMGRHRKVAAFAIESFFPADADTASFLRD